jgi:hypothetical protein
MGTDFSKERATMSTNSTISVELPDNKGVKTVYCHWDGYLEGVGATLLNDFNTQEKAEALVALGDLSSVAGGVEAYHRDRGEAWSAVAPRDTKSVLGLRARINTLQEYNYIFSQGAWYVFQPATPIHSVLIKVSDLLPKES